MKFLLRDNTFIRVSPSNSKSLAVKARKISLLLPAKLSKRFVTRLNGGMSRKKNVAVLCLGKSCHKMSSYEMSSCD